ncbi:MAG: ATP-binding protein [Chthonomonas sp.]|nr:ATP-binding protein [Chthonomonas sp.]
MRSPEDRRRWLARMLAQRTVGRIPTDNLPCFGRAKPIAQAVDLLRGGASVVTLVGEGGAGKSRVARDVARQLDREGWPVFWVDATWALDFRDLQASILATVGAADNGIILLDDVKPSDSPGLAALLNTMPGMQLLCTAKAKLGIGEREIRVGSLTQAASRELFARMNPGVRLPSRVARVPLALLLLAAAGASSASLTLPPATSAAPISKEQIIMSSISLLDQPNFLKLLSLCTLAGPFNEAIGREVVQASGTSDTNIQPLVDLAFLQVRDANAYIIHDDVKEQVWQAARDRRLDAAVEQARDGHATVFVNRARSIGDALRTGAWVEAMQNMLADRINCREALRHTWVSRQFDAVKTVAQSLSRPLFEAGYLADFREFASHGLEASMATADTPAELEMLGLQGALAGREADEETATNLWTRRLSLAREQGDWVTAMDALGDLAHQAFGQNDDPAALEFANQGLELVSRTPHASHEATLRSIRCRIFARQNQTDDLSAELSQMQDLLPTVTERALRPFVLYSMALLYIELAQPQPAEALIRALIGEASEGQRVIGLGWALRNLGQLSEADGNLALATRCFVAASKVFNEYETAHKKVARAALQGFEDRHGLNVADEILAASELDWPELIATI